MKRVIFLASLALIIAFASTSFAQENKEVLALKNKIIDIQNKGKLGFKNFTLADKIISFGSYVPAKSSTVAKGSKLKVYYEPVNVFTNRVGGQYESWYTQDMIIADEAGKKVIFEKKDALNQHTKSGSPVFDHYVTNSMDLGQLPAGKYTYKAILKDKLSNQTATASFKFAIK